MRLKSSLKRFVKMALAAMLAQVVLIPVNLENPKQYLVMSGTAAVAGLLMFLEKFLRWEKEKP